MVIIVIGSGFINIIIAIIYFIFESCFSPIIEDFGILDLVFPFLEEKFSCSVFAKALFLFYFKIINFNFNIG